jgi:phage virion morphogenesis protein
VSDEITKIEVKDKVVRDYLDRLMQLLQNPTPLMADIAQQLEYAAESQFSEEKGPDGQAWPDLADSTKARREKRGYTPIKMLQASGILAESVSTAYGSDYAQIGSNMEYARIHFFGGQAGRGLKVTIPARPYLPVTADGNLAETTRDDIVDIMKNYLESAKT